MVLNGRKRAGHIHPVHTISRATIPLKIIISVVFETYIQVLPCVVLWHSMRCMEVQQKVGRPSLEGLFWTTPLDETNVSLLCMMRGRAVLAS
ncbi:hypothetical protein CCHR01_15795 [Colletotrichum chrysophilum]|uniref:Uncharacterized protein n=1 Tax=Colletotrichum chrysophilum TaxID=1836956 RepID=A0AAD9A719_9PEZI|nr:hypothetical protein CCHR01_15795 [Colletotrichum chrysophilum]